MTQKPIAPSDSAKIPLTQPVLAQPVLSQSISTQPVLTQTNETKESQSGPAPLMTPPSLDPPPSATLEKLSDKTPANWLILPSPEHSGVVCRNIVTGEVFEGTQRDFSALMRT